MTYLLVGLLVLGAGYLVKRYAWDSSRESSVLDIRETAEKRINELTVSELHERVQEFLIEEGYTLHEADGDGAYQAVREDEVRLVRVDPAATFGDPRKMNQLILQLRRSEAEQGVLVTTRPLDEQSRALAEKSSIRVVEPDELLTNDKE
jgi:hypothetical protein